MSRRCWRGRAGFPTRSLKRKKRLSPTNTAHPGRVSSQAWPCRPSIWLRHDLAHFKKVRRRGHEAQIQALPRLRNRILCRHPEGRRPGLSADLHRYIRQARPGQTLQNQNPDHGSRHLNDKVLPFYEPSAGAAYPNGSGNEYCGRADRHDYQLFLAINDIDHTKTKVKSPQTNGICERFHKTILQEFYQVTFRKRSTRPRATAE